jgi:hypothetical protein
VLDTQTINKGGAATEPTQPIRDGYLFDGWDTSFSSVTADLTVTAQYTAITTPTIYLTSASGKAGETVDVDMKIINNPGVAGAKIAITYDTGLVLSDATLGSAFGELDYTKPPYEKNPCYLNWDSLDQESHEDGVIITLHITIPSSAVSGDTFKVSCTYVMGDIYDYDLNDVTLNTSGSVITVK